MTTSSTDRPAPQSQLAPRIVGRAAELAAFDAALDRVASAEPAAIVVTGEAGSGKTLLLDAAEHRIAERRWYLLRSRGDPLERQIPMAVLARAVAPLQHERNPDVAEAAAALLTTVEALGSGPRADVEASFGRVCGQATTLFTALLDRRPVALLLDDLDTLDDDTLAVLAILVRRLTLGRLAVLATSRIDPRAGSPQLVTVLSRLEAETELSVVELTAMPAEHVGELIAPILGAPPDAVLAGEVHGRAGGNPFFAVEIAVSLVSSGALTIEHGQSRLTSAGRDVALTRGDALLERFVRLGPTVRAVLEAIAVVGRASTADLELLAAVSGARPGDVADAFDELVRHRLLVETDTRYQFAHDLVREALYDRLGPARRRHLHAVAAQHLAADRAAGRPTDVMALARHVSIIAEPGDAQAIQTLAEAGDAARRIAPGSAAALYDRALQLHPDDPDVRALLLARRSRALSLAARPAEAVEAGTAALAVLVPGDERRRTVTTVISALVELGHLDDALAVADAEVDGRGASPALLGQRAGILWHLQRFDAALAAADDALALPVASPAERLLVLGPLLLVAAYTDRPRPLVDLAAEMLRLGEQVPTTLQLYAAALTSYAFATSGYVAAALPPLRLAEELVDQVGGTAFAGNILVARVFVDWLQGRWEEATDGIRAARLELEDANYALLAGALQAIDIEIQTCRGQRPDDALLTLAPAAPNIGDLKAWALAGVREAAGDIAGARTALVGALRERREQTAYVAPLLARRIDVELAAGDAQAAEQVLAMLEADRQTATNPWAQILLHRCRAQVRGDADEARAAVAAAQAGGYAYETTRAQLVLAELDPTQEKAALAAYQTLQALGADPLRRRVAAVLRDRGIPVPRRRRSGAGPLSESEMKIAQLVQQGMRNKEIAAVLHYSTRTVEVYLSRIYRKLGISSRLELARVLDTPSFGAV